MRIWLILVFAVLVTSCSLFSNKPGGLINEDEFIDVLVDMHMTDAVVAIKGLRIVQDSTIINLYYDDVMKKHNISRKQLDETVQYYSEHANKYDRVYDEVLEILSKRQKQFNESKEKPDKQDSDNKVDEK